MGHLGDMEVRKAWGVLRGWHKEVDPAASKPYYRSLDKQTEEHEALYRRRDPPGAPIPSRVSRTPRADGPPTDLELHQATRKSSNGRTGGASKMRVEDLKAWLWGMEQEERGESGYEGAWG